ncbi:MAG: hypothetical protein JRJ29_16665 [Deltaproteobacteria bacterium]|nr:hypothetical protein [Deltaproteobacteria bacterium]
MGKIFEVIETSKGKDKGEPELCLGIRMRVGGSEGVFPITRPCRGLSDLEKEFLAIEKDLSDTLDQAKRTFGDFTRGEVVEISPDMGPEEIWARLSQIEDEGMFIRTFNTLDEEIRKSVAEYVLTRCNIFSGKALVFSSRYDSETALMV